MVRGSGKFKTKRGGGRSFSKHLDINEDAASFGNHRGKAKDEDEEDEDEDDSEKDSEEGSGEEESEEEEGGGEQQEISRAERKALKKKQAADKLKKEEEGDEEDADLINPNHVTKKLAISDLGTSKELTRREREEKEKKDAKDRYWKLHVQGKTEEAKSDLARLAKIRADREAAQAKRQAEAQEKLNEIEANKKAQLSKRRT